MSNYKAELKRIEEQTTPELSSQCEYRRIITIAEILDYANKKNIEIQCMRGNRNIWEIQRSTKRKPGFIKIAVTDDIADMFLNFPMKAYAVFLPIPISLVKEAEQEKYKGAL